MDRTSKLLLYWAPRALGIAFVLLISLFAFDVFSPELSLGKQLLLLALHLVPAAVVAIVLAVAWKWEWPGGAGFIALGLLYMAATQLRFSPVAYIVISGGAFLIGLLFLADWRLRRKLQASA